MLFFVYICLIILILVIKLFILWNNKGIFFFVSVICSLFSWVLISLVWCGDMLCVVYWCGVVIYNVSMCVDELW